MAHDRKLVLGGVSLTRARPNRHSMQVMCEVRDELESLMIKSCFLNGAPFLWIGLIFRYGLVNSEEPKYKQISTKHGDLSVTIELDTNELIETNKENYKLLINKTTLLVLISIGKKYNLSTDMFETVLKDLA